jgi:hypothetical protein
VDTCSVIVLWVLVPPLCVCLNCSCYGRRNRRYARVGPALSEYILCFAEKQVEQFCFTLRSVFLVFHSSISVHTV